MQVEEHVTQVENSMGQISTIGKITGTVHVQVRPIVQQQVKAIVQEGVKSIIQEQAIAILQQQLASV